MDRAAAEAEAKAATLPERGSGERAVKTKF